MSQNGSGSLTRRQWLASGLAAGGLALTAGRWGWASPAKGPMTIGCSTVSFRKYPLEEARPRIRRAGYEYFEPQATGPVCPPRARGSAP